eukprot:GHVS01046389.1.p1 GENE.GHVS01046389.1~~GHVS01046389.1.p1  ORF type:complete len:155 (+),score=22.53 GHVS01046389.1:44-508(+)
MTTSQPPPFPPRLPPIGRPPAKVQQPEIAVRLDGKTGPPTQSFSMQLGNSSVQICLMEFANKFVLMMTEDDADAVACWVEACSDRGEDDLFGVRIVFGDRTKDYPQTLARELISHMAASSDKALLTGLTFKNLDLARRDLLNHLINEVKLRLVF